MKLHVKIFFSICFLANSVLAQKSQILTPGVLTLTDGLKSFEILNLDKTLYLKISKEKNGNVKMIYKGGYENSEFVLNSIKKYYPYYSNESSKYKTPLPIIAARAIYPEYDICIFDSEKLNNGYYKIFINGKWKLIKANSSITYKTWSSFLRQAYVKSEEAIYKRKSSQSGLVKGPKNNSYKIIDVDNDWVKVECSRECEGCENGKIVQGWIRWKMGKTILINLYYSC